MKGTHLLVCTYRHASRQCMFVHCWREPEAEGWSEGGTAGGTAGGTEGRREGWKDIISHIPI